MSSRSRPLWHLAFVLLLMASAALDSIDGAADDSPRASGRAAIAVGTLEGQVTRPDRRSTRTGDRYQSSTGEARDIQDVAAVVYIAGAVPGAPAARPSGARRQAGLGEAGLGEPALPSNELAQQGEAFRPTLLVVPVGASVRFPNGDPVYHNVFSYSRPKRFDLGRYPRGESKTVVFDKPGYVKVLCEVHKWMRAGVLVVQNPYYAVVPDSGRFRFDDVPAGRHLVVVETFDRRAQAEVTIPEGGTANLTLTP